MAQLVVSIRQHTSAMLPYAYSATYGTAGPAPLTYAYVGEDRYVHTHMKSDTSLAHIPIRP